MKKVLVFLMMSFVFAPLTLHAISEENPGTVNNDELNLYAGYPLCLDIAQKAIDEGIIEDMPLEQTIKAKLTERPHHPWKEGYVHGETPVLQLKARKLASVKSARVVTRNVVDKCRLDNKLFMTAIEIGDEKAWYYVEVAEAKDIKSNQYILSSLAYLFPEKDYPTAAYLREDCWAVVKKVNVKKVWRVMGSGSSDDFKKSFLLARVDFFTDKSIFDDLNINTTWDLRLYSAHSPVTQYPGVMDWQWHSVEEFPFTGVDRKYIYGGIQGESRNLSDGVDALLVRPMEKLYNLRTDTFSYYAGKRKDLKGLVSSGFDEGLIEYDRGDYLE